MATHTDIYAERFFGANEGEGAERAGETREGDNAGRRWGDSRSGSGGSISGDGEARGLARDDGEGSHY